MSNSNPGLVYNQVPSAGQWNGYFAAKQDYNPILDGLIAQGGALGGGPTSGRPAIPVMFQSFFDTTLGFPVWWNGTNWVNAAGAIS